MPLAFHSLSHGTIAFGFFNIETDMLLLDRYFFFATDFCSYLRKMVSQIDEETYQDTWPVYEITQPEKIGDLMGAIHGIRFTGFIGDVYQRFPFPSQPEDFKQKPYGDDNQSVILPMIDAYAKKQSVSVSVSQGSSEIAIGVYRFGKSVFQELIAYVWQGGYPRWKNESSPDYVAKMKKEVLSCKDGLFEGIEIISRTSELE